jgi:hypothetical protein
VSIVTIVVTLAGKTGRGLANSVCARSAALLIVGMLLDAPAPTRPVFQQPFRIASVWHVIKFIAQKMLTALETPVSSHDLLSFDGINMSHHNFF